jgi:hypothetical protein
MGGASVRDFKTRCSKPNRIRPWVADTFSHTSKRKQELGDYSGAFVATTPRLAMLSPFFSEGTAFT